MSSPFIGEIRMFAGNFAPSGWAFCEGQYLPVNQNEALFNLLGTIYGGDGQSNFRLPDCRGRIPIHKGQGNGLSNYKIGASGGNETVYLTIDQLPPHNHSWPVSDQNATDVVPSNNNFANSLNADVYQTNTGNNPVNMNRNFISPVGLNQPHNNLMPTLCVNFIISLFGIYPTSH